MLPRESYFLANNSLYAPLFITFHLSRCHKWLIIMYINRISLSVQWHIIDLSLASIFHKKTKLKKDLTTSLYHPETPLFTSNSDREVFLKHLTQHLTQQVTFLMSLSSIDTRLRRENKVQMQNNEKREVLGEVLSDLFKKHLPVGIVSKQRGFGMVK